MRRALLLLLLAAVHCCVLPATALNFAVIGDWGLGGRKAGWIPEIRSAENHNYVCKKINCNFTLSCGDNIYVGNVLKGLQDSFEDMFVSPAPFFPSIGNHDNAGPQIAYTRTSKRWKFPAPYYSFTMPLDETGYTIQVFAVNTNDGSLNNGRQYGWLEEELKKSTARWKIIFGHHPAVGSGRHSRAGSVGRIQALMDEYNAQVFFAGHDHIVDVNNNGGRLLAISGGMARGGMMLRGIAGANHRYTLTHPGEFNKYGQDWPGYGMISARVSPNVMNLQVWDNYQAMTYDWTITHDWIAKSKTMPAAQQKAWPSPEVVLQARKEELSLPTGPGGGTAFSPEGSLDVPTSAPTTTPSPGAPPATTLPAATVVDVASKNEKAVEASNPRLPNTYLQIGVSTECLVCKGKITAGQPFTIFITGETVTSSSRLFLTTSPLGCDVRGKPELVPGTNIMSPVMNTVDFTTTTNASIDVYGCYSRDLGKTYVKLEIQNNFFGESSFVVAGPIGSVEATAAATAVPEITSTAPPPSSSNGGSSGHSPLTLFLVGALCLVAGIIGAVFILKAQQQQQRSFEQVPSDSSKREN